MGLEFREGQCLRVKTETPSLKKGQLVFYKARFDENTIRVEDFNGNFISISISLVEHVANDSETD